MIVIATNLLKINGHEFIVDDERISEMTQFCCC